MKMNVGSMVKTELLRSLVVSVYTCKSAGDSQLLCILILHVRFPKGCLKLKPLTVFGRDNFDLFITDGYGIYSSTSDLLENHTFTSLLE